MSETPVVIKINYANKQSTRTSQSSDVVTVWHIPRILAALTILLALIIAVWPSASTDTQDTVASEAPKAKEVETQVLALPAVPESSIAVKSAPQSVPTPKQPVVASNQENAVKVPQKAEDAPFKLDGSKPAAVIYDRHVLRAALVAEMKENTPGPRLQPSISLGANGTQELFYFTEIKHPKQSAYQHQWFKNDQSVLKKNLAVKGDPARLVSTKKLTAKDRGVWSVVLLDSKGKALSESRFVIN